MRHWQRTNLAPDRTNLIGLSTIQTLAFVQNTTAHGILQHVIIVACSLCMLLLQFLFGQISSVSSVVFFQEIGEYFVESVVTFLLRKSLFGDVIYGLIQLVVHLFTQVFIVHLVIILALHILTQLLVQLILNGTHRLDGLVCSLQSVNQVELRHFFHFAFHHHDVVLGGTYHQVHIGLFHLFDSWVDDIFAIDACHTNLTDIEIERNI